MFITLQQCWIVMEVPALSSRCLTPATYLYYFIVFLYTASQVWKNSHEYNFTIWEMLLVILHMTCQQISSLILINNEGFKADCQEAHAEAHNPTMKAFVHHKEISQFHYTKTKLSTEKNQYPDSEDD